MYHSSIFGGQDCPIRERHVPFATPRTQTELVLFNGIRASVPVFIPSIAPKGELSFWLSHCWRRKSHCTFRCLCLYVSLCVCLCLTWLQQATETGLLTLDRWKNLKDILQDCKLPFTQCHSPPILFGQDRAGRSCYMFMTV